MDAARPDQQRPLRDPRRSWRAAVKAGTTEPAGRAAGRPDTNPEIARLVVVGAGRAPDDLRGSLCYTALGLQYLPAVARQLYHCRDLGEPFDFLTWFEYAPEHAAAFEELVAALRATAEWTYVEREVDIRLERA